MKTLMYLIIATMMLPISSSFSGMIYQTEKNGAKFFTNKKIQAYEKAWPEIPFYKTKKPKRAKADKSTIQIFKKVVTKKEFNSDTPVNNNNQSIPLYYKREFLQWKPVYEYPNISTRQKHVSAGRPLFWR